MRSTAEALSAAREQFPITRRRSYLDLANMNSPPRCVTDALAAYYAAMQETGGDKKAWLAQIETTRQKAATLLGCDPAELAFCKNTSEGLNIAANAIAWQPGDNVVVPANEHPNNVYPWLNLRRHGVEVRLVPETPGWIDASTLAPFIDARTRAIALADVSFHPGQRNDVESVAALCNDKGIYLVVDGVQAVGLLDVRLNARGIGMWAASGHKGLLSPHGMGLFYCRRDLVAGLSPAYVARASTIPGSSDDHFVATSEVMLRDDARRFEIGNFNYSGIYAMGAALDLLLGVGIEAIERHVLSLGRYLTEQLAARGIDRLGPAEPERHSSIGAFRFPGEGWVEYLAANHIVVSGRRGAVRVSLGLYNTIEELDQFVAVVDRRMRR